MWKRWVSGLVWVSLLGARSCPPGPTRSWRQITFLLDISKCLKYVVLSFLFCTKKNMKLGQMIPYFPFSSTLFWFHDLEHRRDLLGRKALSIPATHVCGVREAPGISSCVKCRVGVHDGMLPRAFASWTFPGAGTGNVTLALYLPSWKQSKNGRQYR